MIRILGNLIFLFSFTFFLMPFDFVCFAEIQPNKVHISSSKKSQFYVLDGLFTGGDRTINEVNVNDIRRAVNFGFERIAIDLIGSHNGEPTHISRAPYFQVSAAPEERRIIFTLRARTRLKFNAKKVISAFKQSPIISNIVLLPNIEDNAWSFVLEMKSEQPIEVFELSSPVRIIVDVRTSTAKNRAKSEEDVSSAQ